MNNLAPPFSRHLGRPTAILPIAYNEGRWCLKLALRLCIVVTVMMSVFAIGCVASEATGGIDFDLHGPIRSIRAIACEQERPSGVPIPADFREAAVEFMREGLLEYPDDLTPTQTKLLSLLNHAASYPDALPYIWEAKISPIGVLAIWYMSWDRQYPSFRIVDRKGRVIGRVASERITDLKGALSMRDLELIYIHGFTEGNQEDFAVHIAMPDPTEIAGLLTGVGRNARYVPIDWMSGKPGIKSLSTLEDD